MHSNQPKNQPLKADEPKLAETTTADFKINYMQNIRKQRKKRAIAENP